MHMIVKAFTRDGTGHYYTFINKHVKQIHPNVIYTFLETLPADQVRKVELDFKSGGLLPFQVKQFLNYCNSHFIFDQLPPPYDELFPPERED